MQIIKTIFFTILFISQPAFSKNLAQRLGMGVKTNSAINLPALAAVYFPNADYAFVGSLGVDTQKNNSKFAANAGLRKIVFTENQMNFYMGGSLGVINNEVAGSKSSGFEISALYGAEFFFTGLDSLAFTFEGGASVVSLSDVRFRTVGDHPFNAGIVFYF